MASPSISFRISRSAEDLAETIHALSQRLVTLEQRLSGIEALLNREEVPDASELEHLEHVERLLQDCRDLLELPGGAAAPPRAFGEGDPAPIAAADDSLRLQGPLAA